MISVTGAVINSIIKKYKSGVPVKQIAKVTGMKVEKIYKILQKSGVSNRDNTKLKHERIIKMFLSGVPAAKVAEQVQCKTAAIYKVLWANNIDPNKVEKEDNRGAKELFDDEQKQEICRLYLNHTPSRTISAKFGCSAKTIHNILAKMGYERNQSEVQQTQFEENAITLYQELKSALKVAAKLGVGSSTVYRILNKHEIHKSEEDIHKWKIPYDKVQDVIIGYQNGFSTSQLAKEYNVCSRTIANLLKANGIKLRNKGRQGGVYNELTPNQITDLKNMWRNNEDIQKILNKFGCISVSTLNRWLKKLGEKLRRVSASGENHGNWKGGRHIDEHGYVKIHKAKVDSSYHCMVDNNGYVAEHRYIMAKKLGRPLDALESVHHKATVPKDENNPDGLQLRVGNHGKGESYICAKCGSIRIELRYIINELKYVCNDCGSSHMQPVDLI